METKNRTKCQGCIHVINAEADNLPKFSRTGFPINRRDSYCELHDKPVRAGAWRNCDDEDSATLPTHPSYLSIHKQDIKDYHIICEECNKVVDTTTFEEVHPHAYKVPVIVDGKCYYCKSTNGKFVSKKTYFHCYDCRSTYPIKHEEEA